MIVWKVWAEAKPFYRKIAAMDLAGAFLNWILLWYLWNPVSFINVIAVVFCIWFAHRTLVIKP